MSQQTSKKSLYIKAVVAANILLLVVFSLPFLSSAKSREIFVDDDAKGKQDGSAENPFKTISAAIKKAKKDDKIFVRPGKYKENITIPEEVEVHGADRDDVTIEAKDDDEPVVRMKDDTEISKVTIKGGEVGIEVGRDDEDILIYKVIVKDNDEDGIRIKEGSSSKSDPVTISKSTIRDNDWNGLYSKKRRVVLVGNEIYDNGRDGIELAAGSSSWMEDNTFRDNERTGMKLTLDGSEIWTKNNAFRNNSKDGIEISAFGREGRIDISKAKFTGNDGYAIARVQKEPFGASVWNGFTSDARNYFLGNGKGNVSPVIRK
ncbi:MAG: hypothetical protein UY41_C0028G0008 [Candidatus Moranbacteria bacterium GW2011_GWE1_49_15]|nr:MAG: hypothetical protein UX75_C0028G0011 [Candidatus Moranbacteria bacterium GW2011_GWE2_47_10]KKW06357.1 MAG: hypothetical protein UY41_C0028G0008 [Candidatus Moranbacteria bacterium GW2011_GWE1_49_15]HBP01521.1 hypothetical protein [Candidatus Moranbacteria bacterium]